MTSPHVSTLQFDEDGVRDIGGGFQDCSMFKDDILEET